MKQQLGLIVLALALVMAQADDAPAKEDEKNPSPNYESYKVDTLVTHLVDDKDLSKMEFQAHALSAPYRAKVVEAMARYLAANNELKHLNRPEGQRLFQSAWTKMKSLCQQVVDIYKKGIKPEHVEKENWEQLYKITQYIVNNRMFLPDEVLAHLTGGRKRG